MMLRDLGAEDGDCVEWLEDEPDASEGAIGGLIRLIEQEKAQMVAVATGGPRIDGENPGYKKRRRAISSGLRRLNVDDPNPHGDLWQWYGHWSAELLTYASRRQYISALFEPTLSRLRNLLDGYGLDDPHVGDAPIDWPDLEVRLDELKARLAAAQSLDDRQDVGRRAREIIIDAVNLAFDESMVTDGDSPKAADAVARFDWIVRARFSGSSNEKLRAVCKSTWQLAQRVTHNAGATELEVWLTAQVTVVLVRTLQRIAAASDV